MTRSLYNSVIKSNTMNIQDQETVVIDANALIAKKLEAIANSYVQSAEMHFAPSDGVAFF